MAPVSRTTLIAKIHKVLKKNYKPAIPPADRPVLEHLLFACCLEDARYEAAEEAFAALVHTFFDWNEVRVTSLTELSEVMSALPDPRAAANRIKRALHAVFEELYSFDLEDKRKKTLGPNVKWLEKLDGSTRFSVAYVVQSGFGGHSIPIDTGTMAVLRILDIVSQKDADAGEVPGLERAVNKAKGVEFGSLLHQLGADFTANPFSPQVRETLLQIDPEAAKRFPQRRPPRPAESQESAGAKHAGTTEKTSGGSSEKSGVTGSAKTGKAAGKPAAKISGKGPEKVIEKTAGKASDKAADKTPEKPVSGGSSEKPSAKADTSTSSGSKKKADGPAPAAPAATPKQPAVESKKNVPPTKKGAESAPPAKSVKADRTQRAEKPQKAIKSDKKSGRDSSKKSSASEGLAKRKPR